ncbi:hypothetical protein [Streptomyces antarcticus]|uniref:hypothetical protein n=1 Tax=Streptomyces antarcticus TaxID=2996458 RepID=UPI002270D7C7|nr:MULTISPECIES: hypothetical protein [unclassified Streptomyces]MCY0943091.1 hypothetical protein [Streptomyces sp. H34-AA3]MCZ4084452.1 hypothetical protein [Streptomyces sp. H34-S5]
MTILAQLRRTALFLPGTSERVTSAGLVSFTVWDTWFVSADQDGRVRLRLPPAEGDEVTGAELLAMHGVGPKAVRVLAETLAATGRRLGG